MAIELKVIKCKHKASDAATIRRAIAVLERKRGQDEDVVQTLLYLNNTARLIDEAFAKSNVVPLRPDQPEPPRAA